MGQRPNALVQVPLTPRLDRLSISCSMVKKAQKVSSNLEARRSLESSVQYLCTLESELRNAVQKDEGMH